MLQEQVALAAWGPAEKVRASLAEVVLAAPPEGSSEAPVPFVRTVGSTVIVV